MIDFSSFVGRLTGKGGTDGASTGAKPSSSAIGASAGGQFAALVNLAAQFGSNRDQIKLGLVVDNAAGNAANVSRTAGETSDALQSFGLSDKGSGEDATEPETHDSPRPQAAQLADLSQPGMINAAPLVAMAMTPPGSAPIATTSATTLPTVVPSAGMMAKEWQDKPVSSKIIDDMPLVKYVDEPVEGAADKAAESQVLPPALGKAPKSETVFPNRATQQSAPNVVVAKVPQSASTAAAAVAEQTASVVPGLIAQQGARSAPAVIAAVRGEAETVDDQTAQSVVAQVSIKPGPLAGVKRAAPARQAAGAGIAADTVIVASKSARDESSGLPVAATAAKSAATVTTSTTEPLSERAPFRAIVEALPPVIQSGLTAPSVHAVRGPSTSDALSDQVVDMGVSGQWIDRMAREIVGLAAGTGHTRFTLDPPHLGRIQVDLWQDQGATNVRLMTETEEAAQRLHEGRHALQSDARVAALSLGMITVEKSSNGFDQGRDRQNGDPSGQAQQQAGDGAGHGGTDGQGQPNDWVRRSAQDEAKQSSDARVRGPAERVADGRVRFA